MGFGKNILIIEPWRIFDHGFWERTTLIKKKKTTLIINIFLHWVFYNNYYDQGESLIMGILVVENS